MSAPVSPTARGGRGTSRSWSVNPLPRIGTTATSVSSRASTKSRSLHEVLCEQGLQMHLSVSSELDELGSARSRGECHRGLGTGPTRPKTAIPRTPSADRPAGANLASLTRSSPGITASCGGRGFCVWSVPARGPRPFCVVGCAWPRSSKAIGCTNTRAALSPDRPERARAG